MGNGSKLKKFNIKNFLEFHCFLVNSDCRDSFGLRIPDFRYENLGFSDFFEKPPTSRSSNFFSTEPISIIFDFLKSARSETLISAVFITA